LIFGVARRSLAVMESQLRENRHSTVDEEPSELGTVAEGAAGGSYFRILHIDDDIDDRALVARELRGEMPDVALIEAADPASLEDALERGAFDMVITDYDLRWGNGLDILRRLQQERPWIPVIMFTGTGNEEIAVAAMKAGVRDYILKSPDHFKTLCTAVRRIVQRADVERAVSAEARYKELFDTVPVGLFRSTPKGEILDANTAFLQMTGFTNLDDLLSRNFGELHPTQHDFAAWRDKLERDGAVTCVECQFRESTGATRWVEIHAKALRDPDTRQIYYEGSVEDISQRKGVEQEREQLIEELRSALGRVRSLAGLLPICSSCKKIRDSGGHWNMLESYIENHSQAHFTHSFCPDCARRLYPEIFLDTPQ
jgi:PAS domain S-box-containing protein